MMIQKKKIGILITIVILALVFFTKTGQKIVCQAGRKPGFCSGIAYLYYANQSYENAKEFFELDAKRGVYKAQSYLGHLYHDGLGTPQDYTQAKYWYEKAAAQGHTNAMLWLGVMYEEGYGVASDARQAIQYYKQAADYGEVLGLTYIGIMYQDGKVVEKDYIQAAKYYQQACNAGETRKACIYLEDIKKKIAKTNAQN